MTESYKHLWVKYYII